MSNLYRLHPQKKQTGANMSPETGRAADRPGVPFSSGDRQLRDGSSSWLCDFALNVLGSLLQTDT